jgi:hypothetical protein
VDLEIEEGAGSGGRRGLEDAHPHAGRRDLDHTGEHVAPAGEEVKDVREQDHVGGRGQPIEVEQVDGGGADPWMLGVLRDRGLEERQVGQNRGPVRLRLNPCARERPQAAAEVEQALCVSKVREAGERARMPRVTHGDAAQEVHVRPGVARRLSQRVPHRRSCQEAQVVDLVADDRGRSTPSRAVLGELREGGPALAVRPQAQRRPRPDELVGGRGVGAGGVHRLRVDREQQSGQPQAGDRFSLQRFQRLAHTYMDPVAVSPAAATTSCAWRRRTTKRSLP